MGLNYLNLDHYLIKKVKVLHWKWYLSTFCKSAEALSEKSAINTVKGLNGPWQFYMIIIIIIELHFIFKSKIFYTRKF